MFTPKSIEELNNDVLYPIAYIYYKCLEHYNVREDVFDITIGKNFKHIRLMIVGIMSELGHTIEDISTFLDLHINTCRFLLSQFQQLIGTTKHQLEVSGLIYFITSCYEREQPRLSQET